MISQVLSAAALIFSLDLSGGLPDTSCVTTNHFKGAHNMAAFFKRVSDTRVEHTNCKLWNNGTITIDRQHRTGGGSTYTIKLDGQYVVSRTGAADAKRIGEAFANDYQDNELILKLTQTVNEIETAAM